MEPNTKRSYYGVSTLVFELWLLLLMTVVSLFFVQAQAARAQNTYTMDEIVNSGQRFFGLTSGGLATAVEKVFQSYGLPNGYVLVKKVLEPLSAV